MKAAFIFLVSVFLLMACGGGGGGGALNTPTDPGMPGETVQPPSVQPPSQEGTASGASGRSISTSASPAKQPGLSAKGATVTIGHSGDLPTFAVNKNGTAWTRDGFAYFPGGGDNGDWTSTATKLNAAETERFRVVTDIAGPADADYLAYGYWSRHPASSLYHNDFEPFYYGSMPYAGDVRNLSGQATYRGNAIGAYKIAHKPVHSPGSVFTYGYFEARVRLTASFGPSGQVEGRMTNIQDLEESYPDGTDPLSGFGDPSPFFADYDSSGSSFANKGCGTSGCDWGGYFLGPSDSGQVPTGAAGWFEELGITEPCTPFVCRTVKLDGSFGAQLQP